MAWWGVSRPGTRMDGEERPGHGQREAQAPMEVQTAGQLGAAREHLEAVSDYLLGAAALPAGASGQLGTTALPEPAGAGEAPANRFIVIPLVVAHHPPFGALQVEGGWRASPGVVRPSASPSQWCRAGPGRPRDGCRGRLARSSIVPSSASTPWTRPSFRKARVRSRAAFLRGTSIYLHPVVLGHDNTAALSAAAAPE